MEDRLIHSLAQVLADRLNRYAHREGNDYLRLVYGLEIFIMNMSKTIIIFLTALLTGMIFQTIAALVGFQVIRRPASGVHAKNSTSCTVSSIVLFILAPYLLKGFEIGNLVVLPVFCFIILFLYLYAPGDTESRPLVGKKKRARLKRKAVIYGSVLMAGTLLLSNGNIKAMVTLGAIYEAVSVLPITYRVLNKKWNNYEQYEASFN